MAKKIVLQNDIDLQYQKFSELTKDYSVLAKEFFFRLSLVSGAFRRSGGQTTIVSTCKLQSRRLIDIANTLRDGAELMRISKEKMQNLDATIRQEINNTNLMTVNQLSYGDATSDSQVWESEKAYWDSFIGTRYVCIFDENGNVRPPYNKYIAYGRYTFGNEADTMQCVGYAWARFEELSGTAPGFSCGFAGNIGNCYPDNFEQVTDFSKLKVPALAYNYGTKNNPNGHVVVIEGFAIGPNGEQIVYYTEANNPQCADGTMHSATFDSFSGIIQLK